LGGNAGCIVHEDADLERAATRCAVGGFSYAGQSCISVQRIFVHENAYEKFVSALVSKVEKLKLGDPADEATDVGPLIRQSDVERVQLWVDAAVSEGAKVLTGGHARKSMFEPTVLTGTKVTQKVNCMEVFAPVVTVEKYRTFDEALRRVNDSPFGLQAGVFTDSSKLIFEAFARLDVGGVMINDVPTVRIDHMPYGGVKDSGLGREGVKYAMEEMMERKLLVM
jgi:acyl-CoA reductase-like NAD-dependent aldehyde dehydrogenase